LKSEHINFGNAQNTLADECSAVGINCAQHQAKQCETKWSFVLATVMARFNVPFFVFSQINPLLTP